VKGGMVGTGVLSASDIEVLADLPSRDALLAQFAGALSAPLQQMAGLIQALPRNLAYGLSALIEQRQADGGEAESTPAPEAASTPAVETEPTPAVEAGGSEAAPADSGSDSTPAPEAAAPAAE
jgi:hypothetical protein